jgi:hypothetical protein
VIGFTVDEIFGSEKAAELNGHLMACLRGDAPYRYERMQGEGIVEAIATPVPQETGVGRRIVVSARDVTERRRPAACRIARRDRIFRYHIGTEHRISRRKSARRLLA